MSQTEYQRETIVKTHRDQWRPSRGVIYPWCDYTLEALADELRQTDEWVKKNYLWPTDREPCPHHSRGKYLTVFSGQDIIDYHRKYKCLDEDAEPEPKPKRRRSK